MKRLALLPALFAALLVGARGVQQAPPKLYSPDIVLEPATLNLHMLEPNEVKNVEFKVRNVSDKPLRIDSVLTSCHCVESDFDKKEIAPGECGVVRLKVTAATLESKRVIATVRTSGARMNVAEFMIDYAVIPPVLTQPRAANFGRPRVGEKAELAIKVVVHLPRELAEDPVLEPYVAAKGLPVKLTFDPPVVVPIREDTRDLTTTLHLVLDTSHALPAFDTNVVFTPKSPRTYRPSTVRLQGEVRGAAWFEYPSLAFGMAAVGKPKVLSIRLCGDGGVPPKLEEATVSSAVFAEKHEVEADTHCVRFDLTCTPAATGPVTGELRVKVASLEAPLALPLSAIGR